MMQVSFSWKLTLQLRRWRMAVSYLGGTARCGAGSVASGHTKDRIASRSWETSGQGTSETISHVTTVGMSNHLSGHRTARRRLRGMRATRSLRRRILLDRIGEDRSIKMERKQNHMGKFPSLDSVWHLFCLRDGDEFQLNFLRRRFLAQILYKEEPLGFVIGYSSAP